MTSDRTCETAVPRGADLFRRASRVALAAALTFSLAACYGNDPRFLVPVAVSDALPQSSVPAAPPLPFDEAVLVAADALFASVRLPEAERSGRQLLVIDPLIDGVTGSRSAATASMEARIAERVRERHAERFDLRPLSTAVLTESPLVLLGSFTGLGPGARTVGEPNFYRIWLVLADLRSGRVVARGVARALPEGVDTTPARFEREAPLWLVDDASARAYLRTCERAVGEPVDPRYIDGVFASALVADGMTAFDAGRYRDARDIFETALRTPGGDQLRTHNGLYLVSRALGRSAEAEEAFGRGVEFGLRHQRLAVKMVFQPASTLFWPDPAVSGDYPMWVRQIARRTADRSSCLRLAGHTSATGSPAINDRLSLARAERVRAMLADVAPPLAQRAFAYGRGSRELVIGTGRDDATDLLDRRVEFEPVPCSDRVTTLWQNDRDG
jgi:hypothetical protein